MPKRIQQIKQVINKAKMQVIISLSIKTVPFMVWSTKSRKRCKELYKLDAKLTIFTIILTTNMIKSSALQINSYPFLLAGLLIVAKSLSFRSKLAACLCMVVLARKVVFKRSVQVTCANAGQFRSQTLSSKLHHLIVPHSKRLHNSEKKMLHTYTVECHVISTPPGLSLSMVYALKWSEACD